MTVVWLGPLYQSSRFEETSTVGEGASAEVDLLIVSVRYLRPLMRLYPIVGPTLESWMRDAVCMGIPDGGNAFAAVPPPVRAMSNGFSLASLLAILMEAVRVPLATGLNVILKVVLVPGATEEATALMVYSAALAPALLIAIPVSGAVPRFWMVKLFTLVALSFTLPKLTVDFPSASTVP